jgi:hypothetical protein
LDAAKKVCYEVKSALKLLNADRFILGHTPTNSGNIEKRCGGKIVIVDVGIAGFYGRHCGALEILDGGEKLRKITCEGLKQIDLDKLNFPFFQQ